MHWWDFNTKSFGGFHLSRILIDRHWLDQNKKSFRRVSAIKNTYCYALLWLEHKIVLAIFSYQEHSLTCFGGTLTQNLFGDFQLTRILMNMHWWNLKTKSFRQFLAIKKTYSQALMGPKHKIFSAICSYQKYLWICIDGTLTKNFFVNFQLSRVLIDMLWLDLNTKSHRRFPAIRKTYWHALVGPEYKIFFGNFELSRILIDIHWWNLNTESSRQFSAIKKTYGYPLVGLWARIFSAIFS